MSNEKQKSVVRLLLARTLAGKLDWAPGLKDETFETIVKDNGVRIQQVFNDSDREDGTQDYIVTLINVEGSPVDTFSDVDLDRDEPRQSGKPLTWYSALKELFNNARRNALGSDKILNSLLADLGDE